MCELVALSGINSAGTACWAPVKLSHSSCLKSSLAIQAVYYYQHYLYNVFDIHYVEYIFYKLF